MLDLVSKVKAYREFNGLSQKEFSSKVDLGKSTISDFENGTSTPSPSTVKKLEAFFDSITPKKRTTTKTTKKVILTTVEETEEVVETPAKKTKPVEAPKPKPKPKLNTEPIEVVFSFDTTGSMFPCLTQVRRDVSNMVNKLFDEIPNIRIGIIAHGDYCDADRFYVTKILDITTNRNEISGFIKNVGATFGGDFPECYELVLHQARSLNWTSGKNKVLVMIGDATPHSPHERQNTLSLDWRNELGLLCEAGIHVYAVQALNRSCSTSFYKEMAQRTGGFHLNLNQFSDVRDLIMGVCYKQQGEEQLQEFYDRMKESGNLTRSKHTFMTTLMGTSEVYSASETGSAVEGRFQSMAIDHDCSIRDFVEAQGLAFKAGKGFYEFTKPAIIQAKKEVLLINNETGDVIMGDEARSRLGLPMEGTSTVKKVRPNTVRGYTPFVQSTSYNRKLLGGATFLYEVEDWEIGR